MSTALETMNKCINSALHIRRFFFFQFSYPLSTGQTKDLIQRYGGTGDIDRVRFIPPSCRSVCK